MHTKWNNSLTQLWNLDTHVIGFLLRTTLPIHSTINCLTFHLTYHRYYVNNNLSMFLVYLQHFHAASGNTHILKSIYRSTDTLKLAVQLMPRMQLIVAILRPNVLCCSMTAHLRSKKTQFHHNLMEWNSHINNPSIWSSQQSR